MRQTKPFIIEIKQTRKQKIAATKTSIWGDLDLRSAAEVTAPVEPLNEPNTSEITERR